MTEKTSTGIGKPGRYFKKHTPGFSPGGRVWIEKDGELYLGRGRMLLLEQIEQTGSIAAAARAMKLGYRNAWLWIDSMNRLAPSPLVEKTSGGSGGGHARLTDEGRKAVADYNRLQEKFQDFLKGDSQT